jgi:type I restriction enzyme S subunit
MRASSAPLGDIADFVNGVAFKPADWEEAGKRIIRIQNLTDSTKPFNRTNRAVAKKYEVTPGDILVSWSATLGVFVWDGPDTALVNQHIFRVVPDVERIEANYLRHMLAGALVEMERHLHGATMKHVNRREFLATTIPLPPLAEQKRIAGILDAADALRAKRRESLAQLDILLQSTFLDMFGDPVGGNEHLFVDLAIPGRGAFSNGPFGSDLLTSELTDEGVPVVYIRDIRDGEYRRVSTVFVTKEKADRLDACQILPGDVLIAKVGDPPGTAAIYPAGKPLGIITQDVIRIRPNTDVVLSDFIVGFLNSYAGRHLLQGITVEATRSRFGLRDLKALTLTLPPLDLQRRFAAIVESVEQQKTKQREHLAELDTLFGSLQSRAFRGDL